ncbi:MAG: SRPBCC family protein, partial [Chloroflexota bacterium]|nr:SRPBCC family protein [Chloroflexota bacterium]
RGYAARAAEPEPGRLLTETDPGTGSVTSFTVTPNGEGSRVRIETPWPGAGGLAGLVERFLAPRLLHRLDADELARLDHYARERAAD